MSTPAEQDGRENRKVEPDRKANDEDRISHKSAVKRIEQYYDELTEYQKAFAEAEIAGDVDESRHHRAYHEHAKGFCKLLRPYLTDNDLPKAEYYWKQAEIGVFQVDPPEVLQQPSKEEMAHALRGGNRKTIARADPRNNAEPRGYTIIGLRDFMSSPTQWEESWQVMFGPEVSATDIRSEITDPNVRVEDRAHQNDPITVVKDVRVPRSIIDDAVAAMEQFRRSIGMAIEMKKDGMVTDHI